MLETFLPVKKLIHHTNFVISEEQKINEEQIFVWAVPDGALLLVEDGVSRDLWGGAGGRLPGQRHKAGGGDDRLQVGGRARHAPAAQLPAPRPA